MGKSKLTEGSTAAGGGDMIEADMCSCSFGAVIAEYALREQLEKLFAEKDRTRAHALGLNGFNFNTPPTTYQ